jgi:hypothetical protein
MSAGVVKQQWPPYRALELRGELSVQVWKEQVFSLKYKLTGLGARRAASPASRDEALEQQTAAIGGAGRH